IALVPALSATSRLMQCSIKTLKREDLGPYRAYPDRATTAPCSSLRVVPRTLPAACAQPRARARNALRLSRHLVSTTIAAQFHRRCDGPQLRASFPWLFRSPPLLHQCTAKRHPIGRVPHRPSPKITSTTVLRMSHLSAALRRFQTKSCRSH